MEVHDSGEESDVAFYVMYRFDDAAVRIRLVLDLEKREVELRANKHAIAFLAEICADFAQITTLSEDAWMDSVFGGYYLKFTLFNFCLGEEPVAQADVRVELGEAIRYKTIEDENEGVKFIEEKRNGIVEIVANQAGYAKLAGRLTEFLLQSGSKQPMPLTLLAKSAPGEYALMLECEAESDE